MVSTTGIKRKRVSKKNKLAWRKHTKVADVEEFLEEQRLEERLGPSLATVPNEQIFRIDVDINKAGGSSKKKLAAEKTLKCFQILEPHTNVPDPIKKRNRVRTKDERRSVFLASKAATKPKPSIKNEILKDKAVSDSGIQDLWGENVNDIIVKDEWANNDTKRHTLTGLGKLRKKKRASVDKNKIPAIEPPHPGMSYNPTFKDHQDLLKEIAMKEEKIIKEEKHLNRVTNDMFIKMTPKQFEEWWLKEMSQGLPNQKINGDDDDDDDDDKETDEYATDDEYKAINPPVKNSKKTLKQRRKQKEQYELQLEREKEKKEKKKISDIHQLKLVKKQLDKLDERINVLREKRIKAKKMMENKPKRLASAKFEEPELPFNMGDEISGNLRNIKKEGNILNDRYKSLQKRNIIEPTVKRIRKKAKVKVVTKPGHKDDWKKTVAGLIH